MEPTHRTLVLSQGFEPVKIVSWQRALTLLFLGKVEVIEEYDRDVKTTSIVIKIPAVVRLLKAFRRHKKPVKFSRINIYGRDKYTCQYCGAKKLIGEFTYDHVVPRSKGGKTEWSNIVSCCEACNRKKANRTPAEAGMRLLSTPVRPVASPVLVVAMSRTSMPDAWRDYLYWTSELEQD
jgi:5-methylcytosine-specific restriction endonuclease McrA